MKKTILSAMLLAAFTLGANAQVIQNNYDSPITGADGQSTTTINSSDDNETISYAGLFYYSFDGFSNYGVSGHNLTPNGIGIDMNFRANFEKYGNYSFDLGINYSFAVLQNDDLKLLLTLSAGPSACSREVLEMKQDSKGNWKEDSKQKINVDAFINPRVTLTYKKFAVSAGYFFWAPKFKFGNDEKADGFNIGIGYSF